MGTWAGIVRVSHMGKRKADAVDFHSERDQVAALREAVEKMGGKLDVLPPELDVSGGLPLEQRPSLLAAVEGVEAGRYIGIVVAYQSRLGRDVEQEEAVWRRVEAAGGKIVMALDGIDASTVDGRMVRRIRGAINHAERERHAAGFEERRRIATAEGKWQRRQTPIGYRKDTETKKLVPSDRADEVRAAAQALLAGERIVTIAGRLGMTPSGVRQMLRNRCYLGELRVGQHVNKAAHPPILDPETFEAVQHTLDSRPRPSRSNGPPALLAGIARCAGCGHLLTRGGHPNRPVYGCPVNHSGTRCPEPATITAKLLDAYVAPIARAELARLSVTVTEGQGVEQAKTKLAAAERELATYIEAVSARDVGAEAFGIGARQRREAVDAARDELRAHLARQPAFPVDTTGVEVWDELNGHERNVLLRALLAAVVVRRAGGRGARVPVAERVQVLAHGASLPLPSRRGGEASGIVAIDFRDGDDPAVLLPGPDALKRPRRVRQVRRRPAHSRIPRGRTAKV